MLYGRVGLADVVVLAVPGTALLFEFSLSLVTVYISQ